MSIESSLVYIEKAGKILMLHRVKKDADIHKGKWNGLGGKMIKGESPKECALREVKEESNLTLNKIKFLGHIMFPNFACDQDWSVFVFTSDDFYGDILDECDEGKLYWIDKKEILDLNLWEADKYFLPYVLKKELFMAKISYKNGELINKNIEKI